MKTWRKIGFVTLAMALATGAGFAWSQRIRDLPPASRGIKMPKLSPTALVGQRAYDATCAKCHGAYGLGTDKGPPLLNPIYNPGHHPDEAFLRAVRNGVRQHHCDDVEIAGSGSYRISGLFASRRGRLLLPARQPLASNAAAAPQPSSQ